MRQYSKQKEPQGKETTEKAVKAHRCTEIKELFDDMIYRGGGCLCGHAEWCEHCDPYSSFNIQREKLRKLRELVYKELDLGT